MAQDTLLGFPAHTLPYRCGRFFALSTVSGDRAYLPGLLFYVSIVLQLYVSKSALYV